MTEPPFSLHPDSIAGRWPQTTARRMVGVLAVSLLLASPTFAATKKAKPAAKKAAAKAAVRKPGAKKAPAKVTVKKPGAKVVAKTPAKPAAGAALKSFTEKLPGTLVKFDMVAVPGGTFTFADPAKNGQKTQVTLKPFWIGKTEVTWDEFDPYAFRPEDASRPVERDPGGPNGLSRPSKPYGAPDRGFGHQGYPAISIAYHSAQIYCTWLSEKTGKKYRLPTEAEWEYACRAGGAADALDPKGVQEAAWVSENAADKTHPVAAKKPNAWGLYDMLGNAGEWTVGAEPQGVLRGGTYADAADKVSCTTRAPYTLDWQTQDPQFPKSRWWLSDGPFVGFRVVCEP